MNFIVISTVFCAVISVSNCGYSGYDSNGDSYFNLRNLGYSQHSAPQSGGPQGYFTNSLDYNPGAQQHQHYQYPVYQQDDLKKAPEYIPVIENGVPKDTPEVQRAKDEHFALFKKLAEDAEKAPENDGNEEELGEGKNIYQKYQSVQPQPKPQYAPSPKANVGGPQQHFTQVIYPKFAPPQPQPQPQQYYQPKLQPQPQPQQYYQPRPQHYQQQGRQHSAGGQHPQGIFIVGPDEPHEVQQARADHFAAHKDVLAYIKHTRKNSIARPSPKYYPSEHQAQSYVPQKYVPQSYEGGKGAASYAVPVTPQSYESSYGGHAENIYR